MAAAARTSLCLECRTALAPGEACDACEDGRVVSLVNPTERGEACAAAVQKVTLPVLEGAQERQRRLHRRIIVVYVVLATLAVSLALWADDDDALVATSVGAGLIGFFVVFGPGMKRERNIFDYAAGLDADPDLVEEPKNDAFADSIADLQFPTPVGASARPQPADELTRLAGTVEASPGAEAGAEVVADVLELRVDSPKPVMLRDGCTEGFSVGLDDDRQLSVPAGRIRIIDEPSRMTHVGREVVGHHLERLDPLRDEADGDPFPYVTASRLPIRVGDRVEVAGHFDNEWTAEVGYRERSEAALVSCGVIWLRLLVSP